MPKNTESDFSKSPIKAASERVVAFDTTVREGYLDVPVSDFSNLTRHKSITVEYRFEHEKGFQLGDRHPME